MMIVNTLFFFFFFFFLLLLFLLLLLFSFNFFFLSSSSCTLLWSLQWIKRLPSALVPRPHPPTHRCQWNAAHASGSTRTIRTSIPVDQSESWAPTWTAICASSLPPLPASIRWKWTIPWSPEPTFSRPPTRKDAWLDIGSSSPLTTSRVVLAVIDSSVQWSPVFVSLPAALFCAAHKETLLKCISVIWDCRWCWPRSGELFMSCKMEL